MSSSEVAELQSVTIRSVGKPVIVQSEKPGLKTRRGILRFFGTVEFALGQFCGIELENAEGKHNGSFKGIRYFQCPPDHGIFIPSSKVFLDPKSSRIRPNSNVISTNIPLKFSDSHSSMQSQVKKTVLQANDEIPSDSNLFAILNTLNKDGTTNVDSGEISTSKRSANQNIPSMHKSSSSDQLTRSKFSDSSCVHYQVNSGVLEKSRDLDNLPAHINVSKQFKRPKSISNNSVKHILATPNISNNSDVCFLPVSRHKSLSEEKSLISNPFMILYNEDIPASLTENQIKSFQKSDISSYNCPVRVTSTNNKFSANNNNSPFHLDFFEMNYLEEISPYEVTLNYFSLLSSNIQNVEKIGKQLDPPKIFIRDVNMWNEKLHFLQKGFKNVQQATSSQLSKNFGKITP